jgi:hypothetical protein
MTNRVSTPWSHLDADAPENPRFGHRLPRTAARNRSAPPACRRPHLPSNDSQSKNLTTDSTELPLATQKLGGTNVPYDVQSTSKVAGDPDAVGILATGSWLPERVITNDELAASLGVTAAWIEDRTGVVERRVADAADATSDLATRACPQRGFW